MQTSSMLCCSTNSISPLISASGNKRVTLVSTVYQDKFQGAIFSGSRKLTVISLLTHPSSRRSLSSTADLEIVENKSSTFGFIETGFISGVHGFQGEVRVKPSTDFPELRFSKPGLRWLRQRISGTETFQEIELLEGRGHPGQSWIVKFNEINSVEQAQKIVGSTLLVTDEDRPPIEEGEFYTHDLIGMRVILKESGELVGTVVNVFNSGANDLLYVRLNMSNNKTSQVERVKVGEGDSGRLVWVPFVEAIVPVVDLDRREMLITPPKGLLELNIPAHETSKKERRELEWKERKKFQRRLIASKKKLSEMEQQHVFHGFRYGDKGQTGLLANQIVSVNSRLLQQALKNIEIPVPRQNVLQILRLVPKSNILKVCGNLVSDQDKKLSASFQKLQKEGNLVASNGKLAILLVLEEMEEFEKGFDFGLLKLLLEDPNRFVKVKIRPSVPLVLVCPTLSVSSLQEMFSTHDYFAFDPEKVWFLEEEKLPVVSCALEEHPKHKILMKSPWEFLQRPVGSGGFISLLSSLDLLDQLSEMGVEYLEVCNINRSSDHGCSLLGLVDSCKANIGIYHLNGTTLEEHFDVVLSMHFMKKLTTQINKLQFQAVLTSNSFVEKVEKDWIDVTPSAPNSYEFRCSVYRCLDACAPKEVCVLDSSA